MTKMMWKEIDDTQAESLNGGKNKWQDLYLGSVGALQINGGDGTQNNYYNFNFYLGSYRKKKS
jgi:hypothetical protein